MTSGVGTVRQSNMELLRIVAMFMIVVYHAVTYVLFDHRDENPIYASLQTLLLLGVPLFVLISGYFGIKPSVKGIFKLYVIILFYNFLFYGIRLLCGDVTFSVREFVKLWFPFSFVRRFWFFKVYLMLYIFSPILNRLRVDGGGKYLVALGIITFYWGWFVHHPSLNDGKNVINFAFMYMLGSWLRMHIIPIDVKKARKHYIIAYAIVAVCVGLLLYFGVGHVDIIKRIVYNYNSPVLILMSVLFFLIFTTFDFMNKSVNWIAASVFAVYMVHENHWFFRSEWYEMIESQYQNSSGILFTVILLLECFFIFAGSILLDKVRGYLMRPVMPLGDRMQNVSMDLASKIISKLDNKA